MADRAFVATTLSRQRDIALECRAICNKDRILYDRSFHPARTIMLGQYRVEVDASGREAILSAGAQKHFNVDQYWAYVRGWPNVVKSGSVVTMYKK